MSILHPATAREHTELAACARTILDALLRRDSSQSTPFVRTSTQQLAELRAAAQPPLQGRPAVEVAAQMLDSIYAHTAKGDHPRYFAFIPGPHSPLSWLGDLLNSAHNPHAGSWLQSAGPSCIEQETIAWMAAQLGLPPATSGGLFLSGGSMANLTALALARDSRLSEDDRAKGVAYVSNQTHSSNAKALQLLGFAKHQIRKIPVDAGFRLETAALRNAIQHDVVQGLIPFAVVATSGTTNTGSIDPLAEIAAIAREHHLWMHVDGAYGASICLSPAHRHLLAGIELADSITWDAHKWLFQTYGCSALLVRDKRHLAESFCVRPEYLRDAESNEECVNYWELGPELTRPARAMRLWFTLQTAGTEAIGQAIAHGTQLAEWAEDELRQRSHTWEIVSPAQLGIVNFRYKHGGDDAQRHLAQRAREDGRIGVLTTQLQGQTVLRICAIHPLATERDMRDTIRTLETYAPTDLSLKMVPVECSVS